MLDRVTRDLKDRALDSFVRFVPKRVSPTAVTVASLPVGLASAVSAAYGLWWWAVALFWVNRLMDGLDGLIARSRNLQSDVGGYLDIMVDFVVYATIPIGVWLGRGGGVSGRAAPAWPLVTLLAVFYVNGASWMYLSALIEKRRRESAAPEAEEKQSITSVVMPTGLIEGTETVVFYTLFFLFPGQYAPLFTIMSAATLVGVVQRIVWARRTL